MTKPEVIAARLRALRERAGLTQADVAVNAGLGRAQYGHYENPRRVGTLRLSQLISILAVYELSLHQFFAPKFTETVLVLLPVANAESASDQKTCRP